MTYQRDPELDPAARHRQDYLDRDEATFGQLPILLVLIVLAVGGYMVFGHRTATDTATSPRAEAPAAERMLAPAAKP